MRSEVLGRMPSARAGTAAFPAGTSEVSAPHSPGFHSLLACGRGIDPCAAQPDSGTGSRKSCRAHSGTHPAFLVLSYLNGPYFNWQMIRQWAPGLGRAGRGQGAGFDREGKHGRNEEGAGRQRMKPAGGRLSRPATVRRFQNSLPGPEGPAGEVPVRSGASFVRTSDAASPDRFGREAARPETFPRQCRYAPVNGLRPLRPARDATH